MAAMEEASPCERPRSSLPALRLDEMSAMLPSYMAAVADGAKDLCGALLEMTEAEVPAKGRADFARRAVAAGFPYARTLADFGFDFQPGAPRGRVEELATLRLLESAENAPLVGSPGVGKAHIATALGVEAVRARKEARFADCARLVDDLGRAERPGALARRIRYYAHASLPAIGEAGYLGIDSTGAELLFQLVSARYERRSTILTANVGIAGWADAFGGPVRASAIADRLCHHCTTIGIAGRSHRMKDLPADPPARSRDQGREDGRG